MLFIVITFKETNVYLLATRPGFSDTGSDDGDCDAKWGLTGPCAPHVGMWRNACLYTAALTIAACKQLLPNPDEAPEDERDGSSSSCLEDDDDDDDGHGGVLNDEQHRQRPTPEEEGEERRDGSRRGASSGAGTGCHRKIAVNWFGGRHHARADCASGFCYVNDVVMAVQFLRRVGKFRRVLVVDVDAHHGDGTQEAFYYDRNVLTLSVHGCGPGIFPAAASASEGSSILDGRANFHPNENQETQKINRQFGCAGGGVNVVNVPLREGAGDESIPYIKEVILDTAAQFFFQESDKVEDDRLRGAVILVCGADAVCGDPLGNLSFSIQGVQELARTVLFDLYTTTTTRSANCPAAESTNKMRLQLPSLVLGAGGYHDTTAAQLWTLVTNDILHFNNSSSNIQNQQDSSILASTTESDLAPLASVSLRIPDMCRGYHHYAPGFHFAQTPPARFPRISSSNRKSSMAISAGTGPAVDYVDACVAHTARGETKEKRFLPFLCSSSMSSDEGDGNDATSTESGGSSDACEGSEEEQDRNASHRPQLR